MYRSGINSLCKLLKKLSLNDGVRKRKNLLQIVFILLASDAELALSHVETLFGEKLGSQRLTPRIPRAFVIDEVKRRKMLLSIFARVLHLTTNSRTKWIIGVGFQRFEGVELISGVLLIGIESNINTFRKIIGIHSHTF